MYYQILYRIDKLLNMSKHHSSESGSHGRATTYFKEIQHPKKGVIWITSLILILGLAALYNYTYQMYLGETSILGYSKKFKLLVAGDFFLTLIILAVIVVIFNLHFVVKVTRRALYFKKPPVSTEYKKIHRDNMEEVAVAKSNDLPSGTIKIKMKGKDGVLIFLEDGRDVFIGSQHPESLKKAVEKLIEYNYKNTKIRTQKVDEVF